MNVSIYMKGIFGNNPPCVARKNKLVLSEVECSQSNPILGIIKRLDVKETEFALPDQTFYVGLAVENISTVFRFGFFMETGILPAIVYRSNSNPKTGYT